MLWILEHCQTLPTVKKLGDEHTRTILGNPRSLSETEICWPNSTHYTWKAGDVCQFFAFIQSMRSCQFTIGPYLILNDSSGSNDKETPANSCAPVSSWPVSTETWVKFPLLFSLKESISAVGVKRWGTNRTMGEETTETADIRASESR